MTHSVIQADFNSQITLIDTDMFILVSNDIICHRQFAPAKLCVKGLIWKLKFRQLSNKQPHCGQPL